MKINGSMFVPKKKRKFHITYNTITKLKAHGKDLRKY